MNRTEENNTTMKDFDLMNEVHAESLRETFYEAITDGDWAIARDMLTRMEDMKISTYQFRREMDEAIAETGDITYVPFEAVIPFETEAERLANMTVGFGGIPKFGRGAEMEEQTRLSAEFGDNNA